MLFTAIMLCALTLATFVSTSAISTLFAEAIHLGSAEEIWLFGSIWFVLLINSLVLAGVAIKEIMDYNDNRPRYPLRNR